MSGAAATAEAPSGPAGAARAGRRGLDRVELGCLLGLAATSLAVLVPLLTRGRPLSGADGLYPLDQLQYFAWIREAAHHGLIGNRFDLAPGDRPFLHPGFLLSGLAARLGLPIPLAYLLWKPVAVAVTFTGALLYVRRLLAARGQRHVALVLALFAVMPASALVAWTGWGGPRRQYTFDFISGEMWTGQYLWGYLMTALAVFSMPLVLLGLERRRAGGPARLLWAAAAGALLITWLQPWQGATLGLIVVAVEAIRWRRTRERPATEFLVVLVAAALPAVYYALLSRLDTPWKLAGEVNAAGSQPAWSWPWWAVALTVLPLAAPAALAYRLRAPSWQELAVRVWPLAALAIYALPVTFPYHAFQGLTLPLAILAVQGVASVWSRPPRWAIVAALAVMILPGLAHKLDIAATNIHNGREPYFVLDDERRALDFLAADRRAGGVLAPLYSGQLIPSATGRETWVGALSWSPDFARRSGLATALFDGGLSPARARALVVASRARFLYAQCGTARGARLAPVLGGLVERVERFGCATVYVLRPRPGMSRAAGPPDA